LALPFEAFMSQVLFITFALLLLPFLYSLPEYVQVSVRNIFNKPLATIPLLALLAHY
jgi:hypothetical protein